MIYRKGHHVHAQQIKAMNNHLTEVNIAPLILLFSSASNVFDNSSNNSKLNPFTGCRFIVTSAMPLLSLTSTLINELAPYEECRTSSFWIHLLCDRLNGLKAIFAAFIIWNWLNAKHSFQTPISDHLLLTAFRIVSVSSRFLFTF